MKNDKNDKESIKNIEKQAFKNIYEVDSEEKLSRYLKVWWCNYYKRPFKDPLLLEYTFEGLLLEYFEQNLINNDERYNEIKNTWLISCEGMTDEEWDRLQEEEIEKSDLEFQDTFKE